MPDNPTPVSISDLPVALSASGVNLVGDDSGTTKQVPVNLLADEITPDDIGAVPTTRTVNGKALSSDITLDKTDIGLGSVANVLQYSASNKPTAADVTYDGTISGLSATTVKGAIDEVDGLIDNLAADFAPVEASSTASTNYTVGSYLVYNGILYYVAAAIASGETITPGSNVTAVTVTGITGSLDTRVDALETALDGLFSQLEEM